MNENFSLTLKEWADEDKPREKMLDKGKKSLTNAELIAILLRSGRQGKSAVDMAMEVLTSADNSLTTLSQMEFSQLSGIKGLGSAKATTLMAALELGWRMLGEMNGSRQPVINAREATHLHGRNNRHPSRHKNHVTRSFGMQGDAFDGVSQPPIR